MNIAIAGTGYVGLSLAVLLAQSHQVTAVDIDSGRVDLINKWVSPIIHRAVFGGSRSTTSALEGYD